MYNELEEVINDFYKLYFKIEQLSLDSSIKCLTPNEIHIINEIGNDKITMNDLAYRLEITMGTISVAINKLEKKLFVIRQKSEEDKRKVYVMLTEKGKLAFGYHGNFNTSLIEQASKDIAIKDLKNFSKVFKKMTSNLYEIKRNLLPVNLVNLKEGDFAVIDNIKADTVLLKYLISKGILVGKEFVIIEKNKNTISIKIDGNIKAISVEDAHSIFCIKREK